MRTPREIRRYLMMYVPLAGLGVMGISTLALVGPWLAVPGVIAIVAYMMVASLVSAYWAAWVPVDDVDTFVKVM